MAARARLRLLGLQRARNCRVSGRIRHRIKNHLESLPDLRGFPRVVGDLIALAEESPASARWAVGFDDPVIAQKVHREVELLQDAIGSTSAPIAQCMVEGKLPPTARARDDVDAREGKKFRR